MFPSECSEEDVVVEVQDCALSGIPCCSSTPGTARTLGILTAQVLAQIAKLPRDSEAQGGLPSWDTEGGWRVTMQRWVESSVGLALMGLRQTHRLIQDTRLPRPDEEEEREEEEEEEEVTIKISGIQLNREVRVPHTEPSSPGS
ncbi:hypothetical protein AK812_SmicGene40840 [Symbiodinium microadriaticum]|uniref:Uncharacterized protein n=1 Tax=Symbiodinium microadriaticum TaxID=2951 RepID=A0A1Q9C7R2_SYMMI|nr:hypothetical protein AK812_SmicGene40840 [Symbiodinium microadriaticum]